MSTPQHEKLMKLRTGPDTAAIEALANQLLAANPADAEALAALAVAHYRLGRFADLEQTFARLEQVAPDSIDLHRGRGVLANDQQRWADAEKHFRRARELLPQDPETLFDYAFSLERQGKHHEAFDLFTQAAEGHPRPQDCWYGRAIMLNRVGRYEDALAEAERAVAAEPDNPQFVNTRIDILIDLGRLKEAEPLVIKAARVDPARNRATLARWYLIGGDLPSGFREMSAHLHSDLNKYRRDVPGEPWKGQPLQDKTLLLYEEQGFGDTIQFIRYAEMLAGRGCNVFVEVRPPLKQMISRVKGVSWTFLRGDERPKYHYHASIMDLPRLMNTKLSNIPAKIPYMKPPPRLVEVWKEKLASDASKLKVGLCWFGRPTHDEDARRSMPAEMLLPLGQLKDRISFYSLQRQAPESALAKIREPLGLIDHTSRLNDFADTAALMMNLDLVISVDTSICHLAGAIGQPVWTLLNRAGEWRWLLDRDDSPWYPTMRLLRQKDASGWVSLMKRVCDELVAKSESTR